ncbi:MAG: HAMP domain-containing histidine kinase [Gammaproteobacteria bacterium]|nr:HAMP domain-containing histidine kinase [Gammaproteobacteria bacterium]
MATTDNSIPAAFAVETGEATRAIARDASRRVNRLVAAFRVVVAFALLGVSLLAQDESLFLERNPLLFRLAAIGYCLGAMLFLFYQRRYPIAGPYRVPVLLALDTLAVIVLVHTGGGITSGVGGLLAVFVGAATLSLPGRYAFFAAAIATLAVLGEQMVAYSEGLSSGNDFVSAGVLGAVIFAIAAAAFPLARRLEESEALAHQRGIDLANLAQLNEYIIRNLRENIVVVDGSNHLRLMNQPAAETMGLRGHAAGEPLHALSPQLERVLVGWRRSGNPQSQPPPFVAGDDSLQVNAYIVPLEGRVDGPVLIFLEDAGALAEKVQQSKLAALGRLTASIAHEVRNPVGAMSHAGQLLEESPAMGAEERRLLGIIRTNSRRVSDIVENILQLSRREATRPQLLWLREWTAGFIAELGSTLELFEGQVAAISTEDVEVRMDPGHLHQIVWNLCENAVKYASENGGIGVELAWGRMPGGRRPYLEVADRGPGVADDLRDRVFEPFATGPKGGTGLGLFISRELCELNRAALIHEPRKGGGSVFRIVFADPARWGTEP